MQNSIKISKRAIRRHHKWRKIQKARKSLFLKNEPIETRMLQARKIADHLKICSCHHSCGNRRHNPWSSRKERITKQERKAILIQDSYEEWDFKD